MIHRLMQTFLISTRIQRLYFAGMDVTNERQKSADYCTQRQIQRRRNALEGAVFGLFAKEDIVNKDGKVIVKGRYTD